MYSESSSELYLNKYPAKSLYYAYKTSLTWAVKVKLYTLSQSRELIS